LPCLKKNKNRSKDFTHLRRTAKTKNNTGTKAKLLKTRLGLPVSAKVTASKG